MGILRRNKGVDHTLLSLKCVLMRLTPTQFLVALDTDSQWDRITCFSNSSLSKVFSQINTTNSHKSSITITRSATMSPTETDLNTKATPSSTNHITSALITTKGASLETLAAVKSRDQIAGSQKEAQRRVMAGRSQKPAPETHFHVPDALTCQASSLSPGSVFRSDNNTDTTATSSPSGQARSNNPSKTKTTVICPKYSDEHPLDPLQLLRRE